MVRVNAPLQTGILFGVAAYVVGSLLVLPMVLASGGALSDLLGAAPVAIAALGWAVLHAWPVFFGVSPGFLLLAPLPAGLLIASGYAVARRTAGHPFAGWVRGAMLVAGYLPVTAMAFLYAVVRIQTVVAEGTSVGTIVEGLNLALYVSAVGYTGVLFPLIFGAIGGYLADRRRD